MEYIMTTVTEIKSMKLSKETIEILKNFASINSNILVNPGDTITTISPVKNVLAEAKVPESFPIQFGLWDLNKFLGVVSLFQDPEFVFDEKFLTVYNKNSSVKFFYSEAKLLTAPTKKIQMPEVVVNFELKQKDFSELMKAAAVLQLPDICVRSSGNKIEMVVLDKKDTTSNSYSIDVGNNINGATFTMYMKAENLKLIPGDYDIGIGQKVVSRFVSKNRYLTYWIALETESSYEA
jgi:hypothetical protein